MKKLSLVLFMVLFAFGVMLAQRTVTGTITDNEGEPLIGASVLVKGTTSGTISDLDGSFSLQVPEGTGELIFSYTGYATQEVTLGVSNVLDVVLKQGALLEEVIVTAVGLEANKRSIGYAVQNIKADDIVSSKETHLLNGLAGKVAGVSVTSSSGSPGSSSSVRIRGNVSINRSNAPLFVVDGVPIDNSEVGNGTAGVDQSNRSIDINPNDIASITVLKGPSATALYGVRAANGAVVITTKAGKAGKPVVTVTARYSMDQVNKLPERQDIYAQGRPSGGSPIWRGPHTKEGFSWGPAIADLEYDGSEYDYDVNGRLVAKGTGNGVPAKAYDVYDYFVNGNTYDLNASVSGGSDFMRYFISGGRINSSGTSPNATFQRTSFRVRVDSDITDKLTAGISANYVNSGGDRLQRGSNISGVMLGLLRNTPTFDAGNGKIGQEAADDPDTYLLADGGQRSYRAGVYDNPYWVSNKSPFKDNVNRIIGYASLGYSFTDWIKLSYKFGIDHYTDRRNQAFDINSADTKAGEVQQNFISNTDMNQDLLLSVSRNITDNFGFSGTVGGNIFQTDYNRHRSIGSTLSAPGWYHINNATDITSAQFINRKKLYGVYGTFDFNYSDYLFLNLTGRNDWSSTLPADNNTFQSYSASLGFAFTDLLGMQSNPIMPYGKLRASYGVVGNDAPTYATSNYFGSASIGGDGFITNVDFPAYGTNAFERNTGLGNDQIVPEKTTTWEIGGEFQFLKGRLGLDITYFESESEDQIIAVDLPASTGFTSVIQNAGIISNKGWEIILDATPVTTNDFDWDIQINYTKIESLVEELAEGLETITLAGFTSTQSVVEVGQPYGVIWGDGFQKTEDGTVIIGANGWPLAGEKQILGDPNPDFTAGLRNTFTYKGVSLSALLDVRQGGDQWCGTCGIMSYFGVSQQSADERNDVVVFDGVLEDGTANNIPVAMTDPNQGLGSYYRVRYGFGYSEMNIFDTSWLRLRELTLAYSLPSTLLGDSFIKGVNIALTGRNLWLSTDYPGVDPETNLTGDTNGFGLDYFNQPNTKSYSATVRFTF